MAAPEQLAKLSDDLRQGCRWASCRVSIVASLGGCSLCSTVLAMMCYSRCHARIPATRYESGTGSSNTGVSPHTGLDGAVHETSSWGSNPWASVSDPRLDSAGASWVRALLADTQTAPTQAVASLDKVAVSH